MSYRLSVIQLSISLSHFYYKKLKTPTDLKRRGKTELSIMTKLQGQNITRPITIRLNERKDIKQVNLTLHLSTKSVKMKELRNMTKLKEQRSTDEKWK